MPRKSEGAVFFDFQNSDVEKRIKYGFSLNSIPGILKVLAMEKIKSTQLKETLKNLQSALDEFEHVPDTAPPPVIDEFRQKTRDLLDRLNRQIEDLDL